MKILILGGAGAQAAYAIEKILKDGAFDEVVLADYDEERAKAKAASLEDDRVSAVHCDVLDKEPLIELMNQADVVANCTGPYYKLLPPTIDAFMESDCKKYVDFCDDIAAFEEVMTDEAKQEAIDKGKSIIIGLGGSPGLIPVEIMYADSLMDTTDTVKLHMIMDELEEGGPAVWDHMLENFNGTVHVWKDGRLQEENGLEVVERFEYDEHTFGDIGEIAVYSLGHPEVYTLPKALPDLDEISIKISMYPIKVMDMVVDFNRIGLLETDPIRVGDVEVAPRSVLLALMENLYEKAEENGGFLAPEYREEEDRMSGTSITVYGSKDGQKAVYRSSFSSLMGPATGFPLAIGARLLAEDKVKAGMMIPEEAIEDPEAFVEEAFASMPELGYNLTRQSAIEYQLASE